MFVINKAYRIALLSLSVLLVACGGGGGNESPNTGSAVTREGTLSLKWAAPTSRSNGDALSLSEISSYTIYFGSTVGDYPYSVAITDPSTTSLEIPDLPAGTYYLVMTATDSEGRESGYSSVAAKEVT